MSDSSWSIGEALERQKNLHAEVSEIVRNSLRFDFIREVSVEDGQDWNEQPAFFIKVIVDESVPENALTAPDQAMTNSLSAGFALNEAVDSTRSTLLERFPKWFPYFNFVSSARR